MTAPLFSLALFGRFEAQYDGRPVTSFATDKIRALFAYLAIESGNPHRRESLAALLWPDYPDKTARSNLRKSLYRLRQTLQESDPGLPERLINQSHQTISLNPEAMVLDTVQFDQLVEASKKTADPHPLFIQIKDLYRGELLKGISIPDAYAFEEWLIIQREVFHQKAVEIFTRLMDLYESCNDPDNILATAVHLLALDPWHERTHRQIMRAHRQKGNRAGAIAQYNELKEILNRELGVEPSQASLALYDQIRSEAVPAGEGYQPPVQSPLRHFPAQLTPLIGRKTELDYLVQTLQNPSCRLLSLTGPGGIGKTRLCIETARRLAATSNPFADGLVFTPLAQVQSSELLVSTIAQNLNLTFRPGADPYKELLHYLKNKRILLVLDNFEQFFRPDEDKASPAVITFLVETLSTAPEVTLFVTSREPLNLQGEWVFSLDGLAYATQNGQVSVKNLDHPASQLFIQTARRFRPAFDPVADAESILEICRLTGGLPLALEIAAAWMRAYDPGEIARQITQNLDFLTSPYRDAPQRQRSIRAVFASAWDQLTSEQQHVLAATAVFRGAFTVQAALQVAQATVLDLAVLVEKSLLRRAGDRRYELHELVRQFAAEKLAGTGREQVIRAGHADFYIAYLNEQLPSLNGPNPQEAIFMIQEAMDNLRAAWQWAATHAEMNRLQQGLDGMTQFLILTGSAREGEEAYAQALSAIRQAAVDSMESLVVRGRLLAHLAWFQSGLGKNQAALENAEEAVALAGRGADTLGRADGLSILGWTYQSLSRFDESETALSTALTLFNQLNKPLRASLALIRLGSVYWRKRDFAQSLAYYQQSLQIEEQLQNKRGINRAYGGIGLVYIYMEKYDEALMWLNKALALDRELGNRIGITRNLGNLGSLYLVRGDYPQALASYQEAARIDREYEHKSTLAIWLGSIANIYKQTGEHDRALEYYDQAIAMEQELGDRFNLCEALLGKGEILLLREDFAGAAPLIQQGQRLANEVQRKENQFQAHLLEARLTAGLGNAAAAERQLLAMLPAVADNEQSEVAAKIYYTLWQITDDPGYARQAMAAYQPLFTRVPKADYRQRIAELNAYLVAP